MHNPMTRTETNSTAPRMISLRQVSQKAPMAPLPCGCASILARRTAGGEREFRERGDGGPVTRDRQETRVGQRTAGRSSSRECAVARLTAGASARTVIGLSVPPYQMRSDAGAVATGPLDPT